MNVIDNQLQPESTFCPSNLSTNEKLIRGIALQSCNGNTFQKFESHQPFSQLAA